MNLEELKKRLQAINDELKKILDEMDGDGADPKEGDDGKADPNAAAGDQGRSFEELEKRANELLAEQDEVKRKIALYEKLETRKKVANGEKGIVIHPMANKRADEDAKAKEKRAKAFVESGRMETRALLSNGKIAKPTKAGGVNGLADVADGIVDDVNAIALTGNGAWTAAYKKTDAVAAEVTDGNAIGGTAAGFDYVTISPDEWGVLDEISRQVKKMTQIAYQGVVEESALIALRAKASEKIIAAIGASALVEKRTSVKLDEKYIRGLVLNFRANAKKGEVKLYIGQGDLAALGDVRGTNEKKPVYEIEFDAGTTLSGQIKDGGTAVKFRVLDGLAKGTQYFGQPGAIDMPMWDNYAIETDEGGDYFKRNMIGIRGLQTANADLVTYHGMQVITQGAGA
ncbi:hypothetical protein [Pseudoramibacter alactolyticus]|uniref:hypothetical protein n=1 Tax=Pseudoramibacter alactolyticus TaxID=113287 RepID=UPI0023546A94|nr:hypothetical protein [Pseudoramibacter alactolyticus]MBM6968674.1 hypothetical protein [Pseudoramibacter alactolyticus]